MVQINFAKREVQCKVVYYGPARSGKTANLRSVHDRTPETVRGTLTSIATDTDRTLFFDFLPLDLGIVAGIRTKIHLYAVPYIERRNAMRLLVLEGVDGVIFVADASRQRLDDNRKALENLRENLRSLSREIEDVPLVWQFNKSDLPDALSLADLNQALNPEGRPAFAAAARSGRGVFSTLKIITEAVLVNVTRALAPVTAAPAAVAPADPDTEELPRPKPEASQRPPAPVEEERKPTYNPPWRQGQVPVVQRDPAPAPAFEEVPLPGPPRAPEPVPVAAAARAAPPSERAVPLRAPPRVLPSVPLTGPDTGGWERPARPARKLLVRPGVVVQPVVERRERPRPYDPYRPVPASQFVTGAAFTLASLITIGYLVYVLL